MGEREIETWFILLVPSKAGIGPSGRQEPGIPSRSPMICGSCLSIWDLIWRFQSFISRCIRGTTAEPWPRHSDEGCDFLKCWSEGYTKRHPLPTRPIPTGRLLNILTVCMAPNSLPHKTVWTPCYQIARIEKQVLFQLINQNYIGTEVGNYIYMYVCKHVLKYFKWSRKN